MCYLLLINRTLHIQKRKQQQQIRMNCAERRNKFEMNNFRIVSYNKQL